MPLQTVATRIVFDYAYDASGNPLANVQVDIRLVFENAQQTNPPVYLLPTRLKTTTDTTGYWQVALVPNVSITPTNSYYVIKVGHLAAYAINVPTGAGTVQSSTVTTTGVPA